MSLSDGVPADSTSAAARSIDDPATDGVHAALTSVGNGAHTGRPFWLETEPEPIYGVLHMPEGAGPPRVAALILPMFGWDSDCSYRARRAWATKLADSGVAAARFDFPGTENSVGSPLAPGRLQSWIDATADAARWLREVSGCERLVAIGIGVGGLVAYQAVLQDAPIDDLALWATRAGGRAYMRELRAYSNVASGDANDAPHAPRTDGVLGLAGHLMSEETAEDLAALKIAGTELPHARSRRVLLIGRDAHGFDGKLRDHLADSGAELTLLEADDFHCLVAISELRMTPDRTISASISWLQDGAGVKLDPIPRADDRAVPSATDSIEFTYAGSRVRERICEVHTAAGRVVGIVSEPCETKRAPYCLVSTNSGELRHTGPNRLFVEVARRAAAEGVPAARFDLPGLGDSDGDTARTFERTIANDADTLAVTNEIYDHLEGLGVTDRFVPAGLCLGGYFAIRTVLDNERTVGAIAINPPTFKWRSEHQSTIRRGLAVLAPELIAPPERREWLPRPLRPAAARIEHLVRSLELEARRRLAHWGLLWRFVRRGEAADTSKTLDLLAAREARLLFLLAEAEPVLKQLDQPKLAEKLRQYPLMEMERLPTHDHILRPLPSQEAALEQISEALRSGLLSVPER